MTGQEFHEVMNIITLVRNGKRGADLLSEIVDGKPTPESLRRLWQLTATCENEGPVRIALREAIEAANVLPVEELDADLPQPKRANVLDEMEADESLMIRRLTMYCKARGREYHRADGTFDPALARYCQDPDFRRAVASETKQ